MNGGSNKHKRVHSDTVKPCKYFSSKLKCPFESIGCKFKHEQPLNPNNPDQITSTEDKRQSLSNDEATENDTAENMVENLSIVTIERLNSWFTYSCDNVVTETYYCDQCNCDFEEEPTLEGHKEIFHEDGNSCDYCDNEQTTQKDLQ